jgi:hypothetical protein
MTGILAVVRQPQPYSSWGWAAIERVKASMGASFGRARTLARDTSAASMDRMRAVYEMQRHGVPPSAELLGCSSRTRCGGARGRGVRGGRAGRRAAGGAPGAGGRGRRLRFKDADPFVRRRAAEALVRMGQSPDGRAWRRSPTSTRCSMIPIASCGGRAPRPRTHAPRRVARSRHEGHEPALRRRVDARDRQHRQRRGSAAPRREAVRDDEAGGPVGGRTGSGCSARSSTRRPSSKAGSAPPSASSCTGSSSISFPQTTSG